MTNEPISHCCEQMIGALNDPEIALDYIPHFREYGIRVLDGGDSVIVIEYCPWCRKNLPESLRSRWFSELELLDIDPLDKAIPSEFEDERWFKKLQL